MTSRLLKVQAEATDLQFFDTVGLGRDNHRDVTRTMFISATNVHFCDLGERTTSKTVEVSDQVASCIPAANNTCEYFKNNPRGHISRSSPHRDTFFEASAHALWNDGQKLIQLLGNDGTRGKNAKNAVLQIVTARTQNLVH